MTLTKAIPAQVLHDEFGLTDNRCAPVELLRLIDDSRRRLVPARPVRLRETR